MLTSIDILLGVSVVMLVVSLMVTVLTQAITNLMQTRGKNLRDGIAHLLRQIYRGLPPQVSRQIAEAILTHPLIKSAGSRFGTVIHREELVALILELAAEDGTDHVDPSVRDHLRELLRENGIDDPEKTISNVRALTLLLEQSHPELSNNQRYAMAFLQEAPSRFLAKVNGWFDSTIDRVADRFTNSARIVTFVGSFAVALVLQLDTVSLVNRLSTDPALRQALVEQAVKLNNGNQTATAPPQTPTAQPQTPASTPQGTAPAGGKELIPSLSTEDQKNLQVLSGLNLIEFPVSWRAWKEPWLRDTWFMKLLGIVLSAMLLSLGAPFWYNALKNLIRLRSMIAQKDDTQRLDRQTNTGPPAADGTDVASPPSTPSLIVGERGDLARMG